MWQNTAESSSTTRSSLWCDSKGDKEPFDRIVSDGEVPGELRDELVAKKANRVNWPRGVTMKSSPIVAFRGAATYGR